MEIWLTGLESGYELEHQARLFFPGARLLTQRPARAGQDLVRAGRSKKSLFAAVRLEGACFRARLPRRQETAKEEEYRFCRLLYELLRKATGRRPPWGMLTGVRPVRIIHDNRAAGMSEEQIQSLFLDHYDCTPAKFRLVKGIADLQAPLIRDNRPRDCSLYVGIPFCPSRCSFCSFVSRTIERERALVQPYVDKLCEEIGAIRRQMDLCGLRLRTIYIGGGTPTSLNAAQLRQLMETLAQNFDLDSLQEYTVEAGRPDCTDREKLHIMKQLGASRISINPQTFEQSVLEEIGRRHSAEAVVRCFEEARLEGHDNINMDLIAGLPSDTVEGFERSLQRTLELDPENITVHTLTLKRASNLVIEKRSEEYADVSAMIDRCDILAQKGYRPYYLYRQKNTLQNLENTGWSKPGKECYYNIYIMEEIHSILSAGAGGSTKLCQPGGDKIQRIFNYKYPAEYIRDFETILKRKEGIGEFYARYLDPQTVG